MISKKNTEISNKHTEFSLEEDKEIIVGVLLQENRTFSYCYFSTLSKIATDSVELAELMRNTLENIEIGVPSISAYDFLIQDILYKQKFDNLLIYLREPISLIEAEKQKLKENEVLGKYLHNTYKNLNIGGITVAKMSCILKLQFTNDFDSFKLQQLSHFADAIAMTALAMNKSEVFYVNEIDKKSIEDFRNKTINEFQGIGKSNAAIEKILQVQLKKFYAENAVCYYPLIKTSALEWLNGDDISIDDAIRQTETYFNTQIKVTFFKVFLGRRRSKYMVVPET